MVDWNSRYYKYTHWEKREFWRSGGNRGWGKIFLIVNNFFQTIHFNHTSPPLILHYLLVHPTLCSFSPPSLKRKSNKTKTKNPNKLKKNKAKRKKKKNKNKTKSTQPNHGAHCVQATYSWAGSFTSESGCCAPWRAIFTFPAVQMQMASGLEAGLCAQLPFPARGFCLVRICAGLRPAVAVSVNSCVPTVYCVWRSCFTGVIHHLWLLCSLHLLLFLIDITVSWGEGFNKDTPFRNEEE